jgi:hypothetical protein
MTLDLEVNEVEVKGLTSLASVTGITVHDVAGGCSFSIPVMLMDWMGLDLDQHPPNLIRCGWIWINIHFHPFPSIYLEIFSAFST